MKGPLFRVDQMMRFENSWKCTFIAFEPWSGLSTSLEEGDHLEDKKNVRLLEPGQEDQIGFDIEIF